MEEVEKEAYRGHSFHKLKEGRKFDMEYCHYYDDEEHDCLDYNECEECPYYYADID